MISGRDTLGFIEDSLQQERSRIDSAETAIADLTRQLLALQEAQLEDYRDLARLRVDMIATGEVLSSIDAMERQVARALQARESAKAELHAEIAAVRNEGARLETERDAQRQVLEKAAEVLDTAEAATQARLDADAEYRAQEQRTREAERVARHAEE